MFLKPGIEEAEAKENPPGALLKKVEKWAEVGFWNYEGKKHQPIGPEWGGVFRIGLHGGLFRLLGFYEDVRKTEFIIADAFWKKRQKLTKAEKDRIDEVARVKKEGLWRKVNDG